MSVGQARLISASHRRLTGQQIVEGFVRVEKELLGRNEARYKGGRDDNSRQIFRAAGIDSAKLRLAFLN